MGDHQPLHNCPGCGAELRHAPRYPWHFCRDCVVAAEDSTGRSLEFRNGPASGDVEWSYAGEDDWTPQLKIVCHIVGRPAIVQAARFGGIVAQPISHQDSLTECDNDRCIDLSGNPLRR